MQQHRETDGRLARPLVTFVVPSYNAVDYLERCLDSLLVAGDVCEILVVNDGSTDGTLELARSLATDHGQVSVIDQPNRGWGGCVNHALELARGVYFKIVDADDSLEAAALQRTLETMAALVAAGEAPDLLFTNIVYDHCSDHTTHELDYRGYLPEGRGFSWDEVGRAGIDQRIMVHACWYQTALLRESGVRLPEGTPYMDSLFVLHPLPFATRLYYLDAGVYRYTVGRVGQSVDVEVVKAHIDQQLNATRLVIDDCRQAELVRISPKMAECRLRYLVMMLTVSTPHLFMIGTPDALQKNRDLWAYLREHDPLLYRGCCRSLAGLCNRRTALGRSLTLVGYRIAQRVFKFS